MEIIKDIINDIPVTYIKTDKFKTVYGSLFFKSKVKKETVTKRSFLSNILTYSCLKYNTNQKLNYNCLENYDASYMSSFGQYGNYVINSIKFRCINDKYLDNNILNNVIDTYKNIIFEPNVVNDEFEKESFDMCYQVYKTSLEDEKENPKLYCYKKMLKNLDDELPYSFFKNLDDLNNINRKNLYEEYLNMINDSEVSLVLVGDIDYKSCARDILENVKTKHYDEDKFIVNKLKEDEIIIKKESMNISGSVVFFGMKCFDLTNYERSYVMPIFSNILGGGSTSKCFDIIREKESLAYYCNTKYDKPDSILSIYAGIDRENFDKVYKLMLDIFNDMNNISEAELKIAKEEITASLRENCDYIEYIGELNYYSDFYEEEEFDKKIDMFNNVSLDDLKVVLNKIKPSLVYMVEGVLNERNNN